MKLQAALIGLAPLVFVTPADSRAQKTSAKDPARTEIETVVRTYFRGYLNAEKELVAQAFHPDTRLFSIDEGKLDTTTMPDWLKNLEARKDKGDIRTATQEILNIDVTDTAAAVKVSLIFPKIKFTDYLSLLKIDGKWRIVGKIYTAQAR